MNEQNNYFILFLGTPEWEQFTGTLEEAIRRAKDDFDNYGRKGAIILHDHRVYQIEMKAVEVTFP